MTQAYTVIFLFDKTADNVLLVYKVKGPYPNTYNGVGGKIELGETPWEGAIREVKEEVGADISNKINWLVTSSFPTGVTLYVFYAQVDYSEVEQKEDEPISWHGTEQLIVDYNSIPLAGDGDIRYYVEAARKEIRREQHGEI